MSATVSVPSAGVKPKNQLFLSIFTGEKKHSIFRQAVKWSITPCWFWQGSYLASTLLRFFWLQRAEASITTPSISTPFSLTLCEHSEKHIRSYENRNALHVLYMGKLFCTCKKKKCLWLTVKTKWHCKGNIGLLDLLNDS